MPPRRINGVSAPASVPAAVVLACAVLAGTVPLGCAPDGGTGPPTTPPPSVRSIAVTPDGIGFTAVGDSANLVAVVRDQDGRAMPDVTVTWIGGDDRVATIRTTGPQSARAIAVGPGAAGMEAVVGDVGARFLVRVEQFPASVVIEGGELRDHPPGATVRVSARVRDRNGHAAAGVQASFRVEDGGGTVDPESAVTGAEGLAAANWTLGRSGVQALSVAAGEASARISAGLCDPIVLGSGLRLGEPRVVEPSGGACGISVEAAERGTYYRLTLVGTSAEPEPVAVVTLSVEGSGPSAGARRAANAPTRDARQARDARADPHPGRRERDQRVLSWIARPDGPEPLPDLRRGLRGGPPGSPPDPPGTRVFTWGLPGTVEDNCTVGHRRSSALLAHNDHLSIYADDTLSPPVRAEDAQVLADYYANFGAPTIQAYFGGVGDVDGDGRILVFIEDLSDLRVGAFVWMGELLSKEDCPASNEAELIRLSDGWVRPEILFRTTNVVVHEAKHVSSHHELVRRANAGGRDHFAVRHPSWVEEGTAQIAAEVSARLGWETIGGPPPGALVTGSDLRRARDMWTQEAHGVQAVLERYGRVMASQPNSLTTSDYYGSGWGFFRFLGDWVGGAGGSRLGDAALFARLNDAAVAVGLDGIAEVTGRTFDEIMIAYAQAVALAGTGSPEVDGVPRFSTYDMTGFNHTPFSTLLSDGRFPYPVTTTGTGPEAPLWLPLAESTAIEGPIGHDGFRVYDFRASAAGDRATFRVGAPEHVRLIVTRIPDQMREEGR